MEILRKENSSTLEKIIIKRQQKAATRQGYISLVLRIAVIALVLWLILSQIFMITQAKGNDMFPAVRDGDLIIGFRLQNEYVKNDVVIYEIDGERRVGRIAAVGKDYITFTENGAMLVNGTTQMSENPYPTFEKDGIKFPYTVPVGSVFILGDYRTQAVDSRDFGAIPEESIECKVITILRRRTV